MSDFAKGLLVLALAPILAAAALAVVLYRTAVIFHHEIRSTTQPQEGNQQ